MCISNLSNVRVTGDSFGIFAEFHFLRENFSNRKLWDMHDKFVDSICSEFVSRGRESGSFRPGAIAIGDMGRFI